MASTVAKVLSSAPTSTTRRLFPDLLGEAFASLDLPLKMIHGGARQTLAGTVTVERGKTWVARVLAAFAALPPSMTNAPIHVRIELTKNGERWTRRFSRCKPMVSRLERRGEWLMERFGPVALRFRIVAADGGMDWVLEHVAAAGIPLPLSWFCLSARICLRDGRYHFLVDSAIKGLGRIVRYEGLLDAGE